MYNEELKERFISAYTKSKSQETATRWTFKACEPFEVSWGSDLCTRNVDELREMSEKIIGVRNPGKWTRINILRAYVRWCLKAKVPGATDAMLNVECDGSEAFKNQMLKSPKMLNEWMDKMLKPVSDGTPDIVFRCFYWLAWHGVRQEDALSITAENFDLGRKILYYDDKQIELCRQSWDAFEAAVKMTGFNVHNGNYRLTTYDYMPRVDHPSILRSVKSEPVYGSITVMLTRRERKYEKETGEKLNRYSYYNVWLSGVFYRTYIIECEEMYVDFSDLAVEFMRGKEYSFKDDKAARRRKLVQVAGDYERDYEKWKSVFY